MRVAFLYNGASEDPTDAVEDEDAARSPVVDALKQLGHDVVPIACTLNLTAIRRALSTTKPEVVFNRVESLGGSDAMAAAVTFLLDAMQLPYTGNPTAALVGTSSKLDVKKRLRAAGLPTPAWIDFRDRDEAREASLRQQSSKFILKAVYEHASFGMSDSSVVEPCSIGELEQVLREVEVAAGHPHFAEQFIAGREFNLSLLGSEPQVLPPAEIDFSKYPLGSEHIVGYNAKCNAQSLEYDLTDRRFEIADEDQLLLERLRNLSIECWALFGLAGYARVDFRVDGLGTPSILEINANPCILPDSGFAAALQYAEIGYVDGVQRILDDAIARSRPPGSKVTQAERRLTIYTNEDRQFAV